MAPGKGIIVKVVEKLFREVEGDVAKGVARDAERKPLALPPGRATRSHSQVRNIKDGRTRWQAAEQNARERWGGGPEQSYRTPAGKERKVDCPVQTPHGTVAVEVKMYQRYRRVALADGTSVSQKVEVPLSTKIQDQIDKDIALRNANPRYDPRWEFQGAGPSDELRKYLVDSGIVFIEIH
ncbi:MAG: hypothetical protein JWN52_2804 [Actinomycetia bacterium]|jgi:hypothetical protein|nr:hypothetical protein [Actinomycetes bacterium]